MKMRGPLASALLPLALLLAPLFPVLAAATPGAATWMRESLFGENADSYVVLVTTMVNEGSYYRAVESLSLRRIDKRTGRVLEEVPLRSVVQLRDASTGAPSSQEIETPAFDLVGYARRHDLHVSFSETESYAQDVALDSTGLFVEVEGRREVLVPMDSIRARFVPSPEPEEPRLVGVDFTQCMPDSVTGPLLFFRVVSSPAGSDVPSSEVLVPYRERLVAWALVRLSEQSRTR